MRTCSWLTSAALGCVAAMACAAAIQLRVWEVRAHRRVRTFTSRCGAVAGASIQLGFFGASSNDRGSNLDAVTSGPNRGRHR